LNLIEIIRRSFDVCKKNFLALIVPFLTLTLVASVASGFVERGTVILYQQDRTIVIAGTVHSGAPDFLNAKDENYFEVGAVEADGTYGLEIRWGPQAMLPAEIVGNWIGFGLSFKSENSAAYHLEIYNFRTASWEHLRSENVGATDVSWDNIIKTTRWITSTTSRTT